MIYSTFTPVIIVKAAAAEVSKTEFKKILLLLDGSFFSETSVPHVEELVRGSGAETILLSIREPPVIPSDRSFPPIINSF